MTEQFGLPNCLVAAKYAFLHTALTVRAAGALHYAYPASATPLISCQPLDLHLLMAPCAEMNLRIVIPVLNEGDALATRLHALQPLRERGAELVVVDGGSTDGTWAIARTLADQVLLAPQGRASQMNAGARQCTASVLLFLHADTQLPDRADQLIAQALQGGRVWGRFDVRISGTHPLLPLVAQMMSWRSRLTGIATGDQAIFVRRDWFERLEGYADTALMEDIALCSQLRKITPPARVRRPVVTSGRRWEKHGLWRTILLMWHCRAAYSLGADPEVLAARYGYAPPTALCPAALAIMAKAPVAGLAKTRLMPLLGAKGAARAQRRFTINTVAMAVASRLGPVTVWCAPDAQHRFFRVLAQSRPVAGSAQCLKQPEGDLGVRMSHAFTQHFAQNPELPLLLMGTDCPLLSPGHLQRAAQALAQHDAVLIPAEDGGYVLIGLRRSVPQAFENITWSTPQVMAQTRAQLQSAGATWTELSALWDVDEPADWQRWHQVCRPASAPRDEVLE